MDFQEFVDGSPGNDLPLVHDREPLTQGFRLFHKVGGEEYGHSALVQVAQVIPDELASVRI